MMKRSSVITTLFLALLLMLMSCESKDNKKASKKTPASRRLVTATIADPKTFNLLVSKETSSSNVVGYLFEGLIRLNPKTLKHDPLLAKSWKVSDDGKVWTFKLRKGVKWSDGEPFTADDVVFTFRAIYDEKVPTSLRDILMINGKPILVEKVDETTVKLKLPEPFAPFLNSLMAVDIMPEHILGKALREGRFADSWGIDTPVEQLIGTGPFIITRYVPAQYVKYKRNPYYWMKDDEGGQLPYLEERTLLIVPNQDTLFIKFTAGETDMISPRPEEVETLKGDAEKLSIKVKKIGLDTGMVFVTFNRNPRHYVKDGKRDPKLDWFTDINFLKALAHAIDKETIIVNTMHGLGKPAVAEISEENKTFHNPNLTDYEYDLKKAAEILKKGGYSKGDDGILRDRDGNKIEFALNTNSGNRLREQICSIIKEDWEKLGMKINYRPLEFNTLVEKLDNNFQWDAILIGFTGGIEPHNGASLNRSSGHLHMWNPRQKKPESSWEKEMDELVEKGALEMDLEKRKKIYYRIQEIYHEELPIILTARQYEFVAYRNKILNYEPYVFGTYRPERITISE